MRSTAETVVDAPIEKVWAAVVDHEGMAAWGPGMTVTLDRPGTHERNGVGAVRRIAAPGPAPAIVEEITVCESPRRMHYKALSGVPFKQYGGEVELADLGARTRITWSLHAVPRTPGPLQAAERLPLVAINRALLALLVRAVGKA
jgi:carbon monoxide dehydrogenase subunit G